MPTQIKTYMIGSLYLILLYSTDFGVQGKACIVYIVRRKIRTVAITKRESSKMPKLIERTNKMQLCSRICYSNIS
jgi:hypothetical protein